MAGDSSTQGEPVATATATDGLAVRAAPARPCAMDLFTSLGPAIAAHHDRHRNDLPERFVYGPDAADALARALSEWVLGRRAVVIADTRTWQAAGEAARDALSRAGWSCEPWILPDRPGGKSPVCDDATHAVMSEGVPIADAYVAVGSGVVNDSTKWLAAERGAPYAVLATAASMNGYASANVAPAIRGVKSLAHGRAPRVVAALPSVIEAAPFRLTAAGLGDVIAKPISTADWIVNHRVFSEPFSAEIASIIDSLEPAYLDRPEALAAREPGAIRALSDALVRSGCAMTLHGSSLPASGGEHLVSHTLDMLADLDGVEHDLHGRQVGVATILAAALYEKLVAMERPVFEPRVAPFDPALWGSIADAVAAEHAKKRANVETACSWLNAPGNWESLVAQLRPWLRPARAIRDCLARSGAACRIEDLGCSRERFLLAVRHCGAIRGRFTSIDLAWCAGLLPGSADSIAHELLD